MSLFLFIKRSSRIQRILVPFSIFLLYIIYLDYRPGTKGVPVISSRLLYVVDCDEGCYTFGSIALRVVIDTRGKILLLLNDIHALTAFSAAPALVALACLDPISASLLVLVYLLSVAQAHLSAPTVEIPKIIIPSDTKCLIIGVNDYVESYQFRTNHTCGYINYVGSKGLNITERYFLKPTFIAKAAETYGEKYDIIFLDRDAEADVRMALSSVPEKTMAMGVLFENRRRIISTNGTNVYKRQTKVVIARLPHAKREDREEMIEALKGWGRFRPWMMPQTAARDDSDYALYNSTFSEMFGVSNPDAMKRHCSRKFVNRGDCMRNRTDGIMAVNWIAVLVYNASAVGLYAVFSRAERRNTEDVAKGRFLRAVVFFFLLASLFIAWATELDDWEPWYNRGEQGVHLQWFLLMGAATSFSLKTGQLLTRRSHVDETIV